MYDDEDEDDEEEQGLGPASGGYGDVDDDDDDDDEDEIDPAQEAESLRVADAAIARGKEDRAFYDNLAKEEDARHNAMRKDLAKRLLAVGEIRQKVRHKEAELRALEMKITIEEDRIDYERRKEYRLRGMSSDTATPDGAQFSAPIPILSKDIDPKDNDEQFSIERAEAHIKQLQIEKEEFEKGLREMVEHLQNEERDLSQLQHKLMRI